MILETPKANSDEYLFNTEQSCSQNVSSLKFQFRTSIAIYLIYGDYIWRNILSSTVYWPLERFINGIARRDKNNHCSVICFAFRSIIFHRMNHAQKYFHWFLLKHIYQPNCNVSIPPRQHFSFYRSLTLEYYSFFPWGAGSTNFPWFIFSVPEKHHFWLLLNYTIHTGPCCVFNYSLCFFHGALPSL